MRKTYQIVGSTRYDYEDKELVSFFYYFANEISKPIDKSKVTSEMMAVIQEMARLDYNCYQREKRRQKKAIAQKHDINNPVLDEIIRNEQNRRLHNAIRKLLPEQQSLIYQIYFEEEKAAEIAKRENVSPSAISKRLSRAEKSLKKLLS